MSTIDHNLQAIASTIVASVQESGRPADAVRLLAVSKTFGPDAVLAAAQAGQRAFGENYLQEALDKMRAVAVAQPALALEWHFIGPIQSNKTRELARHFDWIQSLDRLAIAQRLSAQRPAGALPLNVLLQINISGEPTKHGVAPGHTLELARQILPLPHLRLRGLMAIPEPLADPLRQRATFARMRNLFSELRQGLGESGSGLDTLSIGMSDDLEAAILEGSTMVRIGTAIFGARTP